MSNEIEYVFEKGKGWVARYRKSTLADHVNITVTVDTFTPMPPGRLPENPTEQDVIDWFNADIAWHTYVALNRR